MSNVTPLRPPVPSILAAVDYSDGASLVARAAVEMARQKHGAKLHFLHVNQAAADDEEGQAVRHAELMDWVAARVDGLPPGTGVVAHELSGDPAKLIVETARDVEADVVVVGTHGRRGLERLLLGSVAASVVQHARCPVFVVREKAHESPSALIEPPCPRCVEAREKSSGQTLWCEQHAEKHGRRHTYFDNRASTWVSQRLIY